MIAAAAAAVALAVGTPVTPPQPTGADRDGRVVSVVKAGDGRTYRLALFEARDIPVYPPGTVAECFAYGESLDAVPLMQFGMHCRPPDERTVNATVWHAEPRSGPLSPAQYRRHRRAGRRLPGLTVVAGRAGGAVRRVSVRGPRTRRTIRVTRTGGGFVAVWPYWVEDTTVTVGGRRFAIGRARLDVNDPRVGEQTIRPVVMPAP